MQTLYTHFLQVTHNILGRTSYLQIGTTNYNDLWSFKGVGHDYVNNYNYMYVVSNKNSKI